MMMLIAPICPIIEKPIEYQPTRNPFHAIQNGMSINPAGLNQRRVIVSSLP